MVPTHRGIHGALERLQYGGGFRPPPRRSPASAASCCTSAISTALCAGAPAPSSRTGSISSAPTSTSPRDRRLVPVRPESGPAARGCRSTRSAPASGRRDFETLSPESRCPASRRRRAAAVRRRLSLRLPARGARQPHRARCWPASGATTRRSTARTSTSCATLLDQAALAIENAQLLDQLHRQLERGRPRLAAAHRGDPRVLAGRHRSCSTPRSAWCQRNLAFAALAGTRRARARRPAARRAPADRRRCPSRAPGCVEVSFATRHGVERAPQVERRRDCRPSERRRPSACSSCRTSPSAWRWRARCARRTVSPRSACSPPAWRTRSTRRSPASRATPRCCSPTPPENDPRRELLQEGRAADLPRLAHRQQPARVRPRPPRASADAVDLGALLAETADLLRERFAKRAACASTGRAPGAPAASCSATTASCSRCSPTCCSTRIDAMSGGGGTARRVAARAPTADRGARRGARTTARASRRDRLETIFQPFFTTKLGPGRHRPRSRRSATTSSSATAGDSAGGRAPPPGGLPLRRSSCPAELADHDRAA